MQKIPQIVRERLKAGAAVSGHPDANALTAFAEHSLPERERAGVLAHLAACGNCREIVALALPAIGTGNTASFALRVPWFAWPAFRWGFATAGIALIAVGVVEFEQHKPAKPAFVAKQVVTAPSTTNLQHPNSFETSTPQPTTVPHQAISPKEKVLKKSIRKPTAGELHVYGRQVATLLPIPAQKETVSTSLVANQSVPPTPPAGSQMVAVQAQNEVVEVQTTDSQVAKAQIPNSFVDQSMSYNTGPLTRAKPATTSAQTGAAPAIMAVPRWSITAVGSLQRSLDQGKSWQDVNVDVNISPATAGAAIGGPLKTAGNDASVHGQANYKLSARPIFFRSVATAGNEVWAGGSNAALFHSIDGGDHWTRVLPSSAGAVLTGDVVIVEFSDAQHGTVTTSTPETWITTNSGQTWQKQ